MPLRVAMPDDSAADGPDRDEPDEDRVHRGSQDGGEQRGEDTPGERADAHAIETIVWLLARGVRRMVSR